MKKYLWYFSPLKAVGDIIFGQKAERIIKDFSLKKLPPDCESADWETYELLDDGTRFTIEDGKFASVLCNNNVYYKGFNLIGLSIEEVRNILGKEDEIEIGIGVEDAAYYNNIGLTLWLKKKKVVGATCVGST